MREYHESHHSCRPSKECISGYDTEIIAQLRGSLIQFKMASMYENLDDCFLFVQVPEVAWPDAAGYFALTTLSLIVELNLPSWAHLAQGFGLSRLSNARECERLTEYAYITAVKIEANCISRLLEESWTILRN